MNIKMSADLGKRLAELRKYSNITREDLARRMSVKPKDVDKWESGTLSPDGEQLIKLSKIYKMPIDEILLNFDTDKVYEPQPQADSTTTVNGTIKAVNPFKAPTKANIVWYAFPYPILVVIAFLIAGFLFNVWHPAWMLFLTIPIYYIVIAMSHAKSFTAKANIFPYPILVFLIFLIAGFGFNNWHPSWLIFLTIPIYYIMIAMSRAKSFRAKANIFPYPILCVILFLSVGFDYNMWHPAWMLFLTVPIYYMIVNMIRS
jgi:transcriptional regulator with XRE-family HTH domain